MSTEHRKLNTENSGRPATLPPSIIGRGHRKRVGKDALADALMIATARRGIDAYKRSFAARLKTVCHSLFKGYGLEPGSHYDICPADRQTVLPRVGKTARQIWIETGNRLREVCPTIWIDVVLDEAAAAHWPLLIVPDVRYPNEVTAIRERGGVVLRVDRPDIPPTHDEADDALADFTDWDHIFLNDGDREDLPARAADLLDHFGWTE